MTSQSSSRNNSHTTHSNLSIIHTEHATACCGTTVSQPASQPANKQWRHVLQPALCCAVLRVAVPHSTSFHAVKLLITGYSSVPRSDELSGGSWVMSVRYVSDGNECLPACVTMMPPTCEVFTAFSLLVLNYSAKFRFVRTRALLWNPFLLLVQISVEVRFFVHTCLSSIHVLLAVFFVYYCALLFDLSTRMYCKRVHMCMSRYLRNHILRPSFSVIRGSVHPVRLEISTLYWRYCIEPTQCILV